MRGRRGGCQRGRGGDEGGGGRMHGGVRRNILGERRYETGGADRQCSKGEGNVTKFELLKGRPDGPRTFVCDLITSDIREAACSAAK